MIEAGVSGTPLVTGTILIGGGVPAFAGATVEVTLEEVSRADGAATMVARTSIPHVRHDPLRPSGGDGQETTSTRVPFVLCRARDAPAINPQGHYSVRVWLDRDGDGLEAPDDLYSDQSYPVLTRGFGNTVTMMLGPS